MSKKIFILPFLILGIFVLAGCTNNNRTYYFKNDGTMTTVKPSESEGFSENKIEADKIQIFMFHTTQRCVTCIDIGKLSKKTIDENFQNELQSGKIEFREINIDLPENKELAKKFQASGSALFINAIYDDKDHVSEDVTVWRLSSNETQFKNYLKNKINNFLGK